MSAFLSTIFFCAVLSAGTPADSAKMSGERPVERATMYGLGWANMYDTYLSPQEYRGIEFRLSRESLRRTRWADGTCPWPTACTCSPGVWPT